MCCGSHGVMIEPEDWQKCFVCFIHVMCVYMTDVLYLYLYYFLLLMCSCVWKSEVCACGKKLKCMYRNLASF